jgi:hypothetical protein
MKGGAFSQTELQQLQNNGFDEYQIERLEDIGATFDEITQRINQVMNQGPDGFHGNSDAMVDQVTTELLNEHTFQQDQDMSDISYNNDDVTTNNSFSSQGTMHLDELMDTHNNDSGYTTAADDSVGGKRSKINISKSNRSKINSNKRNKSNKRINSNKKNKRNKNKRRKGNRTRKQRGGMCFGRGVGANAYDPNYSIYNTNELQLFPYKPL